MAKSKRRGKVGEKRIVHRRVPLLVPGEYREGPAVVVVTAPMQKGGSLVDALTYNVTTWRYPAGAWLVKVQFIDADGVGHTMKLPDEVCKKLWVQYDRIMGKCRSARAEKGQQTVKLKTGGKRHAGTEVRTAARDEGEESPA